MGRIDVLKGSTRVMWRVFAYACAMLILAGAAAEANAPPAAPVPQPAAAPTSQRAPAATASPSKKTEPAAASQSAPKAPTPPAMAPTPGAPAAEPGRTPDPSWPKTLPEAKGEADAAAGKTPPDVWTPAELADANMRCQRALAGLDMVYVAEPPIKQAQCGTPAPISLISVGTKPQVSFSPPVTVTCELAAALHAWIKNDLQRLARQQFGAPIIRVETMSSYSCRNAYGRRHTKLSEHGLANALDIAGFVLATGQGSGVLADWGPTEREIRAQIAAAKAAAARVAAAQAAAAAAAATAKTANGPQPVQQGPASGNGPAIGSAPPATALARPLEGLRIPGLAVGTVTDDRGGARPGPTATGLGLAAPPAHLGGPNAKDVAANRVIEAALREQAARKDREIRGQRFIKEAHAAACKIFGTVLGPESNDAHKNHFHVDMAERRSGSFCE